MRRLLGLLLALACALPGVARATLPTISSTSRSHTDFNGENNSMMWDVVVVTGGTSTGNDTDHDARVGFLTSTSYVAQGSNCSASTGWTNSPTQRFSTTSSRTFRLWNFLPNTAYRYRVDVGPTAGGGSDVYTCGVLGTPTLPDTLAAVNFQYDKNGTPASPYLILETNDCRTGGAASRLNLLVAINPTLSPPQIVWYLDEDAISNGKGAATQFRYQAGTGSTTGRIMAAFENRYEYEFGFDGNVVASVDLASVGVPSYACTGTLRSKGPCINHDLFMSDTTGNWFAPSTTLTNVDAIGSVWEQTCGANSYFLNDGFIRQDGATRSLMKDYGWNPRVYPGPEPGIDCNAPTFHDNFNTSVAQIEWLHINSAQTDNFTGTEYLELGFKETDAIIRVLAASPFTRQWTLTSHASDSDFAAPTLSVGITGTAVWEDQHDPHFVSTNELMLFDNTGDPRGSRVLRVTVDATAHTATINHAWMLMDHLGAGIACPVQGVAQEVPGTSGARVVAMCKEETTFAELSLSTGAVGTAPPLVVSVPSTGTCSNGSTIEPSDLQWNRVFPAANLGAF